MHAQRMSEEQQRFRGCLTEMEAEFDAERAEIQATQARGRKEANDIYEAMQRDCEELENEVLPLLCLVSCFQPCFCSSKPGVTCEHICPLSLMAAR